VILDWKKFVLRSDIRNLPLEEQRRKFLKEQLYHDNLISEQRQKQYEFYMSQMGSNGGAGSSGGFIGQASDGPLSGATVVSNVGTTTTNTLGIFTLPETPSGEITVTGGTDSITGVAFTGELKGFPQYKTISPLTTLAFHLKEEDVNLTADTAIDLLFVSSSTIFGIELAEEDKDIMLNKDYVAESVLNNNQQAVAAQSIATYLESVTEMVGSAVKGVDQEGNFTNNNAKVQGYKSIARQLRDTRGAKTAINPETLFEKVTKPDGSSFERLEKIETATRQTIKSQLDNVRIQLDTLARSQAFTSNYLTTQIQAINRGVKKDYVEQTTNLVQGRASSFDNINTIIAKSTGSLAQIEDGKQNDTDATNSKRPPAERFLIGTHGEDLTITQEEKTDKGIETYTLTFEEEIGDYFVIGNEAQRGQTILGTGINDNPIAFADYANYRKSAPTIKILATSKKDDKGNVLQIILSNPGLVIISTQFVENIVYLPVAAGGYTLQESLDGKEWLTPPFQPFTASIAANQTSTSGTITSKLQTTLGELEYNSSTSRYEFSTTSNPPKGTKTLRAHIADFTNEATWTRLNDKDAYRRFQIKNFDTDHIDIADNATYTMQLNDGENSSSSPLNKGKQLENAANYAAALGNRFALPLSGDSQTLTMLMFQPMNTKTGPNGPFKFNIGLDDEPVAQNLQFVNNVCQFTATINKVNYTVTITRVIK